MVKLQCLDSQAERDCVQQASSRLIESGIGIADHPVIDRPSIKAKQFPERVVGWTLFGFRAALVWEVSKMVPKDQETKDRGKAA